MAEAVPTVKVKKGKGEAITINAVDLEAWKKDGFKVVAEEDPPEAE